MARRKYDYGEIRRLRKEGLSVKEIAQRIGCAPTTVWNVARGICVEYDREYFDVLQVSSTAQLQELLKLLRARLRKNIYYVRNFRNTFEMSAYQTVVDLWNAYCVIRKRLSQLKAEKNKIF